MIAELIDKTGEARLTDLARGLSVTHVTANRTIKRLQRKGLVTSQPYRSIFLTTDGRSLAQESRDRHETVVDFRPRGVPAAVSEPTQRTRSRQPGNAGGVSDTYDTRVANRERSGDVSTLSLGTLKCVVSRCVAWERCMTLGFGRREARIGLRRGERCWVIGGARSVQKSCGRSVYRIKRRFHHCVQRAG